MWPFLWILLMLTSLEAKEVFYHTFYETVLTKDDLIQQAKANTTFWCSVGIEQPCDPNEGRRLDGSCNNLQHPTIGTSHTPFVRVLSPQYGKDFEPATAQSGQPKPSERKVRTTLITTGLRPDSAFTQLASHFFVFVAADVISTQDTVNYVLWRPYCCLPKGKSDSQCVPIEVPNDDPVHRLSDIRCLNQTRLATYQLSGCVKNGTTPERISSGLPLFDLSFVYGNTIESALKKGRLFSRGLLKYEIDNGRVYPPFKKTLLNICLLNEPPHETKCYDTPQEGTNSILGVNILSVWFWRNHNRIASSLADLNPCWSDDKLFYTARDINIATFVQIIYYEFFPLLLGFNNLRQDTVVSETRGFRDRYDPHVLPQVSLEFSYILRWAHLMQEGRIKMYDQDGHYMKQVPVVNLTLRTGYVALDNNMDSITQGSFRQAGGKIDYTMDPDMSERVLGGLQRASDIGSSDLNKGRYSGFPPYVDYVKYFSGKTVNDFRDLADDIDADKLELLQDLYENVRDIDLMAGTWVEKPIDGGFAPPTFYFTVVDQLIRSMVSDRHWYERPNRPNAFTLRQLLEVRKATISGLLCDVGDTVTRIQRRGFERAGPRNKMFSCRKIERLDLTAWKDDSCAGYKQP